MTRFTLCLLAGVSLSMPAVAQGVRPATTLESGWTFHRGDVPLADAERGAGGEWAPVTVPHTWNRVGYYLPDPASHLNTAETIDKYQGVGWYRLQLTAPATAQGKRIWLQFDAASRTAEVWLNGKRLGAHAGGFSRFRFDATAAMRPGQANTLLVKVDNTQPAVAASTADVLPIAGDFFVHGGLYRPVSMIVTDAVHLDMLDSGGAGVYAATTTLDTDRATVSVRLRPRNDGTRRARVGAVVRLVDAAGATVASTRRALTLAPGAGSEEQVTLDVAKPRLWNGTADPYLHRLVVDLATPAGVVLDSVDQAFGIREMRVDPDRGFLLNGKPLRLHGVGYHQDREGKGWAISAKDVEDDVATIREMGANTIRLTHYQHGQPIHDAADRAGLILWDEVPLVSMWTLGESLSATPGLRANALQQMRELIRQNYNHASVATWGIANEVDFGKSIPFFITNRAGIAPDPFPLLRDLQALAKAEDPTRPTALATCCERDIGPTSDVPITAPAADLGGANRYFGWYYGSPDDLGPHLDELHAKRPRQPLSLTEYGAGGATTIHSDDALGGDVDQRGRNQPEEYQSYVHERAWATLATKPYLWATWLWNSFDFATTVRREGDALDINTKGLVSYDRKIRKDAYYFYKANWSDAPTVHVTGRRYVDRAYPAADVRVYSNAAVTRLLVNGKEVASANDCPQRVCVFPAVRLAAGTNVVTARGDVGGQAVEDRVEWRLDPAQVGVFRIDSGALVAPAAKGGRFGSDAFFDGGTDGDINASSGYGKPPEPKVVAGTADSAVAQTYREGAFSYRIPTTPGRYAVTLTFMEPSLAAGARRFDVLANGKPVVTNLDIAAETGKPLTALVKRVEVDVTGDMLDLRFAAKTGKPIVSAVELVPLPATARLRARRK
ncbi:glycoside hydrolase family 2 TIM barrel-domain containing protein [Sphingomonas floccifaciens]|uniref:Glycoside hydrolase family 2 TIM barrel-domain containing protein n=1 Tax=Sphingomonas floccifaciens TaxID=1844115 RepID=A0ABW4N7T6_9SPHN